MLIRTYFKRVPLLFRSQQDIPFNHFYTDNANALISLSPGKHKSRVLFEHILDLFSKQFSMRSPFAA